MYLFILIIGLPITLPTSINSEYQSDTYSKIPDVSVVLLNLFSKFKFDIKRVKIKLRIISKFSQLAESEHQGWFHWILWDILDLSLIHNLKGVHMWDGYYRFYVHTT